MTLTRIRGLLEFSILAVLDDLGPVRAARIHDELCERTGRAMSHTNIPTTLVRLAEKRLVRAKRVQWGDRYYAIYSLTHLGSESLRDAREYLTKVATTTGTGNVKDGPARRTINNR